MNASKRQVIIPRRAGETDAERRLREALDRLAGQALAALDSAINFRTAPDAAQRMRHLARASLVDFCGKAMMAHGFAEEKDLPQDPNQQGD